MKTSAKKVPSLLAKAKLAAEIGAAAAVETAETVSISAATAIVRAIGIASTKALTRDRAWSLNQ